jgi:hypothetical protein
LKDRDLLIELDAAGKSEVGRPKAEHLVAEVVNFGVVGVVLFGELRQVFEVLTHAGMAAVRASLHDAFERRKPHALGIPKRDHGHGVASVPRVVDEQSQLHVLLRHPREVSPLDHPRPDAVGRYDAFRADAKSQPRRAARASLCSETNLSASGGQRWSYTGAPNTTAS